MTTVLRFQRREPALVQQSSKIMANHLSKLLVPTDFSEHSQNAIEYACGLAQDSNAQLHLIHVVSDTPGGNTQGEKIRRQLERLGNSLDEKEELAIKTVKKVIPGEPFDAITDYARNEGVDMIVMGTHGRTGLSHFALGSVAERVVRTSMCPVLVMGPRTENHGVTLAKAAAAICSELGENFQATRDAGIQQMKELLEGSLHVPPSESTRMLTQLQEKEWLSWKEGQPGTWTAVAGTEFIERATPVRLTSEPESQAVDLVERARRLRATDIHLDPGERNEVVVRMRIDGKLEEYCRLDEAVGEHLHNQFKTLADLNIAEPFRPQEGRVRLPSTMTDVEVRITTARVAAGDATALRLFDAKNVFLPLGSLGLSESALDSVTEMLRIGEGIVLVTGPTGSGKTTTVYSMLETLGGVDTNVVSVEDPVEFAVPFVRQMNVNGKHDITMTSGLRTILRMDPDVVFLGEIRDMEAAQIAMRAASSGKYVLSTLHTRDVASTITALRDMEIGDRSIAGNLTGIINQRLIRRLCPTCKKAVQPTEKHIERFQVASVDVPTNVYTPGTCSTCRGTGFRGRIGTFEVALKTVQLANAIAGGDSENHLKELLRAGGVTSLTSDALTKAAQGITSMDEALAVRWLA